MRVGDRVEMVDRYRTTLHKFEPSWFDRLKGRVTQTAPYVMVHIDGERLPLRFDERDLVVIDGPSQPSMTGAE